MDINAPAISGSDPGAVPGGSTKTRSLEGFAGPKQDRRTCKGDCLVPVRYHRHRSEQHNCQRQSCSGRPRCLSGDKTEIQALASSQARRGSQAPGNRSLHFLQHKQHLATRVPRGFTHPRRRPRPGRRPCALPDSGENDRRRGWRRISDLILARRGSFVATGIPYAEAGNRQGDPCPDRSTMEN